MIAKLMELANTLFRYRGTEIAGGDEWNETIRLLLLMLAPAAPHISEELWSRRLAEAGEPWASIHAQPWPEVDPAAVVEATREIPVQVNGKLRDRVVVPSDATAAEIEAAVLARERIVTILAGRTPDRIVVAGGGKLVNLVVALTVQRRSRHGLRIWTWCGSEDGPTVTTSSTPRPRTPSPQRWTSIRRSA